MDAVAVEDVFRDYRETAAAVGQTFFLEDEWSCAGLFGVRESKVVGV